MFKDLKKIEILTVVGILILYFVSRLLSLNNFPIFTDEAIYLRWAQIAKNDANWRFISLTDGKQPLFVWLTMISMKIIADPLTAGRLVSVLAGAATLIGLVFLGKVLFQRWKIGMIAGALYVVSPFALVYDRLALMDSLLATLLLWSLTLEILVVKTLRLDLTLILGGVIGLTVLTKTSGFLALYLLPVSLIFFDDKENGKLRRLIKWLGLVLVVLLISQMMYSILRLSPFFHLIAQKDKTFIYPFFEWLTRPLVFFKGNLAGLKNWTVGYLTWPVIMTILAGLFGGLKFFKERLFIFAWFIIPFIGLALFGRVIYPRFIFFMVIPLLLLAAFAITLFSERVKKSLITVSFFIVIILPSLITDTDLITDPRRAKIPFSDSNQYYNDWPSGWGIKESVVFFQEKAKRGKIAVFTEGTFGLLPAGLELYLVDDKNISITGIWPVPAEPSKEILITARSKPTYLIFFQNQPPPAWPLTKIKEVKKGLVERFHTIYQVKPLLL